MSDSNDMYSKCVAMLKFVLLYLYILKEMNSISRRLPFRSLFNYEYLNIVYMYVRMLSFDFSNVYYLYTCMYCINFLNKYCLNQIRRKANYVRLKYTRYKSPQHLFQGLRYLR